MAKRRRKTFEFDAAFSFAGEDREQVEGIARSLRSRGYRIFYDKEYRARLWGKDTGELEHVYGEATRYVIPFISKNYVKKDFPLFEFETAKREAKRRKGEFILPIRLDDSRLLGLKDSQICLSLPELGIEKISATIEEKLRAAGVRPKCANEKSKHATTSIPPLSPDARHALEIIASAWLPLTLGLYSAIFADVDWKRQCRVLSRIGYITESDGVIRASASAKRAIKSNEEYCTKLNALWIEQLEKLDGFVETAILLALHYFSAGEFNKAVDVAGESVGGRGLRHWNPLYRDFFRMMVKKEIAKHLDPEARLTAFNCLGACLSEDGNDHDALQWFKKLKLASYRLKHDGWLGQAYLNIGVTHAQLGETSSAARWYEKATSHGEGTGDQLLLGRALGNLSQTVMADNPRRAINLIKQSLKAKRSARDEVGIAFGYMQLGHAHMTIGKFADAARSFRGAIAIFKKSESHEQHVSAWLSLGDALDAQQKPREAISAYEESKKIAEREGLDDLKGHAFGLLGRIHFEQGDRRKAAAMFRKLLGIAEATGEVEQQICAHHGIAMMHLLKGERNEGQECLRRALTLSRREKNAYWMTRCLVDKGRLDEQGKCGGPDPNKVKKYARGEEKRKNWVVAMKLWEVLAEILAQDGAAVEKIEDAFALAIRCAENVEHADPSIVNAYALLFEWRWNRGDTEGALKVLSDVKVIAEARHFRLERWKAAEQLGCAFQALGRFGEAVKQHRDAVRIARQSDNSEWLQESLNNLGEAFRGNGKFDNAVKVLCESEQIALANGDIESAILAAHNRALALCDRGDTRAAAKVLANCRDRALRQKVWREYIKAWEALGNLAWIERRMKIAERRYRRALRDAKQRKQLEMVPRIALNLASLLEDTDRERQALRLLSKYEDQFADQVQPYLFHSALAELLEKVEDFDAAASQWQLGKDSAELLGDSDQIAICASALAGIYENRQEYDLAIQELQVALDHEPDPELRVRILEDLLRVLLAADDGRAQRVYEEAIGIAEREGFAESYIDIQTTVAAHQWKGDRSSKLESLKALITAMVKALEVDIGEKVVWQLAGETVDMITDREFAPSLDEMSWLIDEIEKALGKERRGENEALNLVLSPFYYARRLLPFMGNDRRLRKEVNKLAKLSLEELVCREGPP